MLTSSIDKQAQAVKCYLETYSGIEPSYNGDTYAAFPYIAEWHNGRENGYVVYMRNQDYTKQINIAFFEHRNSDSIHAVKWLQYTGINPPTIDSAEFGDVYKNKFDTSYAVEYGQAGDMARWIYDELEAFWVECEAEKGLA